MKLRICSVTLACRYSAGLYSSSSICTVSPISVSKYPDTSYSTFGTQLFLSSDRALPYRTFTLSVSYSYIFAIYRSFADQRFDGNRSLACGARILLFPAGEEYSRFPSASYSALSSSVIVSPSRPNGRIAVYSPVISDVFVIPVTFFPYRSTTSFRFTPIPWISSVCSLYTFITIAFRE